MKSQQHTLLPVFNRPCRGWILAAHARLTGRGAMFDDLDTSPEEVEGDK